jgi:hypothetical protein
LILILLLAALFTNATTKPMTFAKPRPFGPKMAIVPPGTTTGPKFLSNSPPACLNCVTLAWNDTNTVDGFNLYWGGASQNYTNYVTTTNHFVTVTNLVYGATYYFAATAMLGGLESDFSSETNTVIGLQGVDYTTQTSNDLSNWAFNFMWQVRWWSTNAPPAGVGQFLRVLIKPFP